jgi:hypothetical protein
MREVLLEQEVHVVREDPELLVEGIETRCLLPHVLGGVHGAEEVDDELHCLKCIGHMCVKRNELVYSLWTA